ncbi:Uncharacterised protein [Raoultella terrigena]|uniref:Uncharacterized protein n=1 Tax=Raoultella terrigena TaxID=577 RepID=A0A4U9DET7_RAOTE|nr:Uncharacterised protein [Raoultella terrigena]
MAHMGRRQNDVRLFILLQLLNHQLRFFRRVAEFNIGEVLRVANFRRIVRRQANHRDIQPAALKQGPGLKQALTGAFLVNIGRQEREFSPLLLLAQHAERIIELVVAHAMAS